MAFGKFGKYYPGGVDMVPRDIDLVTVLKQAFDAFRSTAARNRPLNFVADIEHLTIRSDPRHLEYVLVNLLQNAVKYSPEDGVISVTLETRGGQPMFEVADEGIGIPQAELDELFSPFYRASNVGDAPGTGMGLAIVKKSARLIGATVEVESACGEGSRFRVRLPTM